MHEVTSITKTESYIFFWLKGEYVVPIYPYMIFVFHQNRGKTDLFLQRWETKPKDVWPVFRGETKQESWLEHELQEHVP